MDSVLVARVVAVVNVRWAGRARGGMLAAAEHVMQALFGGDLVRYRERHHRHLSFRAVATSADLAISACSLRDALRVLAQQPTLPPEARTLPYSMLRALLREPDPDRRVQLAARARCEGASKNDVLGWIREAAAASPTIVNSPFPTVESGPLDETELLVGIVKAGVCWEPGIRGSTRAPGGRSTGPPRG